MHKIEFRNSSENSFLEEFKETKDCPQLSRILFFRLKVH